MCGPPNGPKCPDGRSARCENDTTNELLRRLGSEQYPHRVVRNAAGGEEPNYPTRIPGPTLPLLNPVRSKEAESRKDDDER